MKATSKDSVTEKKIKFIKSSNVNNQYFLNPAILFMIK